MAASFGLAYLVVIWLAWWLASSYRTWRFGLFLLLLTIIHVAAAIFDGVLEPPLRVAVVLVSAIAFLMPERLGIGSLTQQERTFDELIRRSQVEMQSGERSRQESAIAELSRLLDSTANVDTRWRAAVRVMRRAWTRRTPDIYVPSLTQTPVAAFDAAAKRYLSDLRLKRTIGFSPAIRAIDESVAMRAYLDDFRALIPHDARHGAASPGRWHGDAMAIIDELAILPIRSVAAQRLRNSLVKLLLKELEIRSTRLTPILSAQYAEVAADVDAAWKTLEARSPGMQRTRSTPGDRIC